MKTKTTKRKGKYNKTAMFEYMYRQAIKKGFDQANAVDIALVMALYGEVKP